LPYSWNHLEREFVNVCAGDEVFPIKAMSMFCPVSCGCGDGTENDRSSMKQRCPVACSVSPPPAPPAPPRAPCADVPLGFSSSEFTSLGLLDANCTTFMNFMLVGYGLHVGAACPVPMSAISARLSANWTPPHGATHLYDVCQVACGAAGVGPCAPTSA